MKKTSKEIVRLRMKDYDRKRKNVTINAKASRIYKLESMLYIIKQRYKHFVQVMKVNWKVNGEEHLRLKRFIIMKGIL